MKHETDLELAERVARKAHEGQFRRDGKTPYIAHVEKVVDILWLMGERDEQVLSAAWLHDVVEDGPGVDLVSLGFPRRVVFLVNLLTKEGDYFTEYLACMALVCDAKRIKVADILANLSDSPTPAQVQKYVKALQILLNRKAEV